MSKGSEAVLSWRKRTKMKLIDAMGGKCQCCGYDKYRGALEFHHLDPDGKDQTIANMIVRPKALKNILNEIKKCILVCANCHREIHGGLRSIPEKFSIFDEGVFLKSPKTNACPQCGVQKSIYNKHCSLTCAGKSSQRVNWSDIDIIAMFIANNCSYQKVADTLGISYSAVKKHVKKHGFFEQMQTLRVGLEPTSSM